MKDLRHLIDELAIELDEPLEIDVNGMCVVVVDGTEKIQIEQNQHTGEIMLSSLLFRLDPGRFREEVLIQTLKENNRFPKRVTFCFIHVLSALAFFTHERLEDLNGARLKELLFELVSIGDTWKTALENGRPSPTL